MPATFADVARSCITEAPKSQVTWRRSMPSSATANNEDSRAVIFQAPRRLASAARRDYRLIGPRSALAPGVGGRSRKKPAAGLLCALDAAHRDLVTHSTECSDVADQDVVNIPIKRAEEVIDGVTYEGVRRATVSAGKLEATGIGC